MQHFDVDMYYDLGHYYIELVAENGDDFLLAHGEDQKQVERDAAIMLRQLAEKIEQEDD
jgi:hypothetical protein